MGFHFYSPAFNNEERIPVKYTGDGEDLSPPLVWTDPPADTRSFAILCTDPDAPNGTWTHWALYNIPPDRTQLEEGYPTDAEANGTRQAVNDFGNTGYGGPAPPPGHGIHHYHFRILALSEPSLDLPADAKVTDVEEAAKPYIIDVASVVGLYSRD
jgi:Raf kinase inhibitor-like YbhB/YbcL family protein